jgi:CRISPR/Cas system-associated protein Cas5 (RAMP superfamily)
MKKYILITLAFILLACGSKKISTNSNIKEKTEFDLKNNSVSSSKVDLEKQYTNATTNERIVTMYGVRFDTIQVAGKPYIIPISFPTQKEENRDINVENYLWRMNTRDSIQNAVQLEFKGILEEKEKKITELKESTIIYQIALLILSILGIVMLVLYFIAKIKAKRILF